MKRILYLVAYDIREPKRLRQMLYILKDYASGGQKSAFECYLSEGERKELMQRAQNTMDEEVDALLVMRMNQLCLVETLGKAVQPVNELYAYIG